MDKDSDLVWFPRDSKIQIKMADPVLDVMEQHPISYAITT